MHLMEPFETQMQKGTAACHTENVEIALAFDALRAQTYPG